MSSGTILDSWEDGASIYRMKCFLWFKALDRRTHQYSVELAARTLFWKRSGKRNVRQLDAVAVTPDTKC